MDVLSGLEFSGNKLNCSRISWRQIVSKVSNSAEGDVSDLHMDVIITIIRRVPFVLLLKRHG